MEWDRIDIGGEIKRSDPLRREECQSNNSFKIIELATIGLARSLARQVPFQDSDAGARQGLQCPAPKGEREELYRVSLRNSPLPFTVFISSERPPLPIVP